MYVLEVEAEKWHTIKFEVPTGKAVGSLIQLIYTLGVGIGKVTVTFRDELPMCEDLQKCEPDPRFTREVEE